jgi:acetyltransferase-like isoleucine patch superfamily enzyme
MVIIVLLLGVLPAGRIKNALLGRAAGGRVARSARIHPVVLWRVRSLVVGERAYIGPGNIFRELARVEVGDDAEIGQFNWFSAAASWVNDDANELAGCLLMGASTAITSRHYVDCSGGLRMEPLSLLGGVRTTVMSHSADTRRWVVNGRPVVIGEASLVFSHVLINPGVTISKNSMVAGGAVVASDLDVPGKLYGGVPAKVLSDISEGEHIGRAAMRHTPRDTARRLQRERR